MGITDKLRHFRHEPGDLGKVLMSGGQLAAQIGARLLTGQHEDLAAELDQLRTSHGIALGELDAYRLHFGNLPDAAPPAEEHQPGQPLPAGAPLPADPGCDEHG